MRPRPFFVVGTDTDVGKTFISSALLGLARGRGLRCIGMKPIAAGCRLDAGSLRSDDALSLMSASDTQIEYETINPIAFKPHIAPHIAAAQAGRALRAADLTAHCRAVVARAVDFVLIEGAGGWLVPINDTETLADVCVALNAAVILVVGMKLGCLNHALLGPRPVRWSSVARRPATASWCNGASAPPTTSPTSPPPSRCCRPSGSCSTGSCSTRRAMTRC